MKYSLLITRAIVLRNAVFLIATCLCAEGANAARTLTLTFEATGTGTRQSGFDSKGTPILASLESATISYVVTEFGATPGTFYFPFTTFFTFNPTGVAFGTGGVEAIGLKTSAKACYNSPGAVAGTYAVDRSCSTLSYNDVGLQGFNESFSGTVTRFTIAEGNTLPNGRIISLVSVIPEASTWLMMLVGFTALGGALRYQRRKTRVSFV